MDLDQKIDKLLEKHEETGELLGHIDERTEALVEESKLAREERKDHEKRLSKVEGKVRLIVLAITGGASSIGAWLGLGK